MSSAAIKPGQTSPPSSKHVPIPLPPKPPPSESFPPCSLMNEFTHLVSPTSICAIQLYLHADQDNKSILAQLPYQLPSIMDSVTHVVCSPRICGIWGNNPTLVKILCVAESNGNLIDGGPNACVTGNLTTLLDITDITPINISVALDGTPTTLDNKITKRDLLPLTLSDGTIYYQT
jgi:hypothetical protein